MSRRDLLALAATVLAATVFLFFLIRILLLRYERGNVYPEYSSLRADPLGTRAFYEALGVTGRFQTERGFSPLRRETAEDPETLFYLSLSLLSLKSFSEAEINALDVYVRNGGRVVITFDPDTPYGEKPSLKKKKSTNQPFKKETKRSAGSSPTELPEKPIPVTGKTQQERFERWEMRQERDEASEDEKRLLSDRYELSLPALWGFGWDVRRESSDSHDDSAVRIAGEKTEAAVPWKSGIYFVRLESEWKVLYYAKDWPVFIRRSWGKGQILVATDSYFLSNEALRQDRRPALVSLVAGEPGALLFDEVHLGTERKEGVMVLAEKFKLEGYLYGVLCVAALFLWRNSLSLVPPRTGSPAAALGGVVSGKDSRSGLVNLLRRNIPASDLLRVCLAEWERGGPTLSANRNLKTMEMEAAFAATQGTPLVEAYDHLRKINVPRWSKGSYATKS